MSKSESSSISRRTVFAGAGAVGALGAIAAVTQKVTAPVVAEAVAAAKPAQAGYQVTDHVKQYYATARV